VANKMPFECLTKHKHKLTCNANQKPTNNRSVNRLMKRLIISPQQTQKWTMR